MPMSASEIEKRIKAAIPDAQIELRDLARTAAADGMVLLANTGILPLAEPRSIALIGEAASGTGLASVIAAATAVAEELLAAEREAQE